jgi:ferritin-like metal-binding protein YciE
VIQLLGELLYVERRSADELLPALARDVQDDGLRQTLEQHRDQTRVHVERVETAFRRLEVALTSNRVDELESMVHRHAELAGSTPGPSLRDLVHAQAALDVEHWEISRYRALVVLVPGEVGDVLRESLDEEKRASNTLAKTVERLAQADSFKR